MDIKEYIIEKLKKSPVKIKAAALYGSWTKGTQKADSDIDLLLIADEINPKKHRRGKETACIKEWLSHGLPLDIMLLTPNECISNFINHNPLFLDIAYEGIILKDSDDFLRALMEETLTYIRNRKLEKLDDGWRFPVLMREPTFLSRVSNKDFAMAMLTDGERDFAIGVNITKDGYFDKAIYHFQQAVEKAVKAVLISFGEFKKTHFVGGILIDKLNGMEMDQQWRKNLLHIAGISNEIEPEVTWSRYPSIDSGQLWVPYEEYIEDDAVSIKEKSEEVIKITKDFIKWWFKL